MAPNKFASMVYRNTNRLTLVLVYVLLEWILIAMILFNSLFSYLILKYADYFGLKQSCVLCSRIDHGRDKSVRRDMICDHHLMEISELNFCPSHQTHCCSMEIKSAEKIENKSSSPKQIDNTDLTFFDSETEEVRFVAAEKDEGHEEERREQDKDEVAEEDNDGSSICENDQNLAAVLESEIRVFGGDSESIDARVSVKMGIEELDEAVESMAGLSDEDQAHSNNVSKHESDSDMFQNMETEQHEKTKETENESDADADSDFFEKLEAEAQSLNDDETKYELEANGFSPELVIEEEVKEAAEMNSNVQDQSSELASRVETLTKALEEVYAELEQERDDTSEASAQTMAMITRLQEEKATLQLEASQYQRMMDEQIGFDQEAVLLLNEIVRRRERENQELEKELEFYRKRFDEKMMKRCEDQNLAMAASDSVSVCCSSFGDQDSDGVSTEDDDHHHHHHNQFVTALDDDPVLEIENERLSILDQLNKLEEKLLQLNGDESEHFEEGMEPKRLLPLFDQVIDEEDNIVKHHGRDNKSLIEDEMGRVYERLQALEEDKEFMNKCMKSVKKGDEGMSLVQEILKHLRALRRLDS